MNRKFQIILSVVFLLSISTRGFGQTLTLNSEKWIDRFDGRIGGHLALITEMLPERSEFDRWRPIDNSVRWNQTIEPPMNVAIANFYGMTDVAELIDGANARHYAIEWFGSMKNRADIAREVSPN